MAASADIPSEPTVSIGTPGGATLPRTVTPSDVSTLIQTLQQAIRFGDEAQAKKLASQLAKKKAAVNVDLCLDPPVPTGFNDDIRVKVYVEDKDSSGVCVVLKLTPSMTIRQLKSKMLVSYRFPPEVQKWIIGKRIAADDDTLAKCGIRTSGSIMYLYLISPKSVGMSTDKIMQKYKHLWPAENQAATQATAQRSSVLLAGGDTLERVVATENERINGDLHSGAPNRSSLSTRNVETAENKNEVKTNATTVRRENPPPETTVSVGWDCTACTFSNLPTRPGCEICGHPRPPEYEVPMGYAIPQDELDRIAAEQEAERLARQRADVMESDDENDGVPPVHPFQQMQQRTEEKNEPHLQLTEKELDKLLRLNDLFNSGVLGDTADRDLQLLRNFDDTSISNTYQEAVNPEQEVNIYQPDTSSFVSGTSNSSLSNRGLDHSDFGRNATGDLPTDHTDYALDSSHSANWDLYSSLTNLNRDNN